MKTFSAFFNESKNCQVAICSLREKKKTSVEEPLFFSQPSQSDKITRTLWQPPDISFMLINICN